MPTTIPPLAHFIWAGGKKLLPKEGVENIAKWINTNKEIENFEAYLWIDKKTVAQDKDILECYKQRFKETGITIYDESDDSPKKQPYLILKDIEKNDLRNEYVDYEIEKLCPNYGSSSDLLRYQILIKYGGFYCDCTDVKPGRKNLKELFLKQYPVEHVMYLEHCPQQPEATEDKIKTFGTGELGNDTFATNADNIFISTMLGMAYERYLLLTTQQFIEAAHSGNNIKFTTIKRTGPGLVQDTLREKLQHEEQDGILKRGKNQSEVRRFRNGKLEFAVPGNNTGNWLNLRITKYENHEDAIAKVIKTIEFEAKYFKILRLDDHIKDLIEATDGKISEATALESLTEVIEKHREDIKYVQLTGEFSRTIDFITTKEFHSIFSLVKQEIVEAISAQSYSINFIGIENLARQLIIHRPNLKGMAETKVVCLMLGEQKPEWKKDFCQQIALGIKYIEHFNRCLDEPMEKFLKLSLPEIQEIKIHLLDRVQKYKEYATVLNKSVESEYKVRIDKIDELLQKLTPQNIEGNKVQPKTPGQ